MNGVAVAVVAVVAGCGHYYSLFLLRDATYWLAEKHFNFLENTRKK
jgi:hypothetical protein